MNTTDLTDAELTVKVAKKDGEAFEDIAADYPALTTDDLEAIKAELEK